MIDHIQSLIESKLRQPFTSIDLTKSIITSIQQQASNTPSSLVNYIQCLTPIFPKLMKPIKLRLLISLLGFVTFILDDKERKEKKELIQEINSFLHNVSTSSKIGTSLSSSSNNANAATTSQDDDRWIQVMSNIIQYKLHTLLPPIDVNNTSKNNNNQEKMRDSQQNQYQQHPIFKRGIDKIISHIMDNSQYAYNLRQDAENKFMPSDNNDATLKEDEEKMEKLIDSFQIGTDVQPYYTPYHYRLLSSSSLSISIPLSDSLSTKVQSLLNDTLYSELNDRCDFQIATLPPLPTNITDDTTFQNLVSSCHILQIDELNDLQKAKEESKEMEAIRIANERKKNIVVNMKMSTSRTGSSVGIISTTTKTSHSSYGVHSRNGMATARTLDSSGTSSVTKNNSNSVDTASLMMRASKKTPIGSTLSGGATANVSKSMVTGGNVRKAGFGRGAAANSVGGRSLTIPSSASTSRSAMAAQALLRKRKAGMISGNSNASGTGGVGSSTGVMKSMSVGANKSMIGFGSSGGSTNSRAAANRAKTKMKMIDVNEVEGLKKEGEERQMKIIEEETRESRKRKIMERAAAKGLVAKKRWGQSNTSSNTTTNAGSTTNSTSGDGNIPTQNNNVDYGEEAQSKRIKSVEQLSNTSASQLQHQQHELLQPTLQEQPIFQNPHIIQQPQNSFAPSINNNQYADFPSNNLQFASHDNQSNFNSMIENTNYHQTQQDHLQQILQPPSFHQHVTLDPTQQQQLERHNQQNWEQLLEKSNKLSDEDRFRVKQFFTNRVNPTPDIKVYKTKLHEEKFIDPETQQIVKETFYIELDYDSFGYKKVRKIKKK